LTEIRNKAIDYLKRYGMDSASTDLKATVRLFMDEMKKGLAGPSSIAMYPTFIETDNPIPVGKKVVVIDAGGTNLRTALVSFDGNYKPIVENFKKYPMPGTGGGVSKDEFFGTLADYIADLVPQGEKIGFCFSYPTVMYPNRDGRLTKFSKEVQCPDVHGEMIGENLLAYLKNKGVSEDREIVILNDTVATLLTGMISFPEQSFSGFIGYIFGTGINGCYVESNAAILKQEGLNPDHHQIINTECGSFGLPPQGDIDKALDAGTSDPGNYLLEKMTSGGYLGLVVTRTLEKAVEDGLFSDGTAGALKAAGRLSTKDADDYIHNPRNRENVLVKALEGAPEEDRELLFHVIDDLTNRAAKLAASALSGIVLKSEKGMSPLEPVCLTVDGTTFYVSYHFKSRFEQYMREILCGDWQRYFEIVRVDDAPLLGAAIAALTN
jgi:hexokinase